MDDVSADPGSAGIAREALPLVGLAVFGGASLGCGESKHPLHVPGHGDEGPFAPDVVEPAQQKLPETENRFDDAEHRLRGVFAQGVKLFAFRRLQAMDHGVDWGWIVRRRRRRGEALAQGWM